MRMGHIYHGELKLLKVTMTHVPMLNMKHDDVCKGCVLRKFSKTTFPSDKRSESMFDLIHFDMHCMMSTSSLRRYEYIVAFINYFSRKT